MINFTGILLSKQSITLSQIVLPSEHSYRHPAPCIGLNWQIRKQLQLRINAHVWSIINHQIFLKAFVYIDGERKFEIYF